MSEIPESLQGTYTTSNFNGIVIRVTMNAMTMGLSISLHGQSMVLLDGSTPDSKLHNITIVDGGKETESVTFNASKPGGKPDTGSVLTLNKDGLTFNDHIVSKIVDLLLDGAKAENPKALATKEQMDRARPAIAAVVEKHFRHLTRYEGAGGSLPLMVGGGAALLLLLMVK